MAVLARQWPRVRAAGWYCAVTFAVGLGCLVLFPVLLYSTALCLVGLGLLVLPPELRLLRWLANGERRRAGRHTGRPAGDGGPAARRLTALLRDPVTRRDLRWLPVAMLAGTVLGALGILLAALPVAALGAIGLWWLFPVSAPIRVLGNIPIDSWLSAATLGVVQLAGAIALAVVGLPLVATAAAVLSSRLLAPSARHQLTEQVETLRSTRAGAVNAHSAELRRIERDLHDGTQARLVSVAMHLGLAERQLRHDPQAAADLLVRAREGAEDAMTELRDVLRTMYPPILADRGLAGALTAVAARCVVPTTLDVAADLGELPAPVEAAAYFTVTEALTNITKHSGASAAEVTVQRTAPDLLLVRVQDNGRGGVREDQGTGVAGMRRRVAALDGTLRVSSPVGGPTTIEVECPCGS
ncbi:sensor histidine kinase [Goodfellowiella coeruleoviolacea]|nr:histidine kinase [Goodfellowiella coeruleoviolacea]